MMRLITLLFATLAGLLLTSGKSDKPTANTRGLEFEVLSQERTSIRDGKIPVVDLTIRIINTNEKPIWIGTLGDNIASAYLRERNPANLRFSLKRKAGDRWTAMSGGYQGTKSGTLMLKPDESVTITLPLAERFIKDSRLVQVIIDVSFDSGGKSFLAVTSPDLVLVEEEVVPLAPPAEDPDDPVEE